jgi:hypothetical protein
MEVKNGGIITYLNLWSNTVPAGLGGELLWDETIILPADKQVDFENLMIGPGRTMSIEGGKFNMVDGTVWNGGNFQFKGATIIGGLRVIPFPGFGEQPAVPGGTTLSDTSFGWLDCLATNIQVTRCQVSGDVRLTAPQVSAVNCSIEGNCGGNFSEMCIVSNTFVNGRGSFAGEENSAVTNQVARRGSLYLYTSRFQGGLSAAASSVSVRGCRSGPVAVGEVEGNIVYISKSLFDREITVHGANYCEIAESEFQGPARLDLNSQQLIASKNVFGKLCTLAGEKSGTVSITDNSFYGRYSLTNGSNTWPDTSLVDKNFFGSVLGPRSTQDPLFLSRAYLLQDGGFCNLPASSPYGALKSPVANPHPAADFGPWALPDIWVEGFAAGQTTIGAGCGEIRADRPSLVVYDVRCAAAALPGVVFTLLCDGIDVPLANPSFILKRSYGDPRPPLKEPPVDWALNFKLPALPAGSHTLSLRCDTTGLNNYTNTGVRDLMSRVIQILPRYGRALNIGVVQYVINNAAMSRKPITDQREQIKGDAVNMLGMEPNEIYTESLGVRYFNPIGGFWTILWLADSIEKDLLGLNMKRRLKNMFLPEQYQLKELDYIVAVVPRGSMDPSADGATYMGYWLNVPHVMLVDDTRPTAWLHEFGHLSGLYWIDIGAGVYWREQYKYERSTDNYGNMLDPGQGACLQNMTVFNPNFHKKSPFRKEVMHFPTLYGDFFMLDTMSVREPAWPIPTTFTRIKSRLSEVLGTKVKPVVPIAKDSTNSTKMMRLTGRYTFIDGQPHIMAETVSLGRGVWPTGNVAANINGTVRCLDEDGNLLGDYYCSDLFFGRAPTNVVRHWQQDFEVSSKTALVELTDFNPLTHVFTRLGYWTIPQHEATNSLRLVMSTGKSKSSSANEVTLEWSVSDSIPSLSSTLYASRDEGGTWLSLGAPATTNRVTVNLETLGTSSNLLFKVVSGDGFRSFESQLANAVPTPRLPPDVRIYSPQDGDCGLTDQHWTLSASASVSSEEGMASVDWRSSIDGLLGTNALLANVLLSEGSHRLTFSARDSRGLTSTSSLTVLVGPRNNWNIGLRDETLQILHKSSPESVGRYLRIGATNTLILDLHNQGVSNTVLVKLFAQQVGAAEQLLGTNKLSWDVFQSASWSCDWIPARQGTNRIRAVIESVPGTEVNILTNQFIWAFTNAAPTALDMLAELTPRQTNITFYAQGWDPDYDPIIYSITRVPTHGTLTINSNLCEYTPNFSSTNDSFEYAVSDGMYRSVGSVRLKVPTRPQSPVILSTNFQVGPNEPLDLQIDALHSPDYFASESIPVELHLNRHTGHITGTLGVQQHKSFRVTAVNLAGSDSRTIEIRVLPAWPKFLSATNLVGSVNQRFIYQCVATQNANTFMFYPGTVPPSWLSINPTNGILTGIPPQPGRFSVKLAVANYEGFCEPILNIVILAPDQAFDYFDYARTVTNAFFTTSGSNSFASYEPGEMNATLTGSLWWRWVAPSNGWVTVDTLGSDFDTTLAVYADGSMTNLTLLGSNDDISSTNRASRVVFHAVAQSAYRIALDGRARGKYQLNLRYELGPVVQGPVLAEGYYSIPFDQFIQAVNSPQRYFANGLPAGLLIETNTGRIYGIPQAASDGMVTLGAINSFGTNTLSMRLRITVLKESVVVATNGWGTISSNYNGAMLDIGRLYSMTAKPALGWVFSNWSGSQATNQPALMFLMQSNLSFTASFVDTQAPSLKILTPAVNSRLSNAVCTVSGTASDNGIWGEIKCQVNNGRWIVAGGTTNWTLDVALSPGSNTVRAFGIDAFGNKSVTNTVAMMYILSKRLAVQTIGEGNLTPNYSNAVLEIGRAFSMKATGINGHAFSNWVISTNLVAGVANTNPTLNFIMQSGLAVQANFVDTNKPSISLTAPTSNQRWSNAVFTVRGTATDNARTTGVWCLTNGFWGLATTTNSWMNWAVDVALVPGTNVLKAYSVDTAGNQSTTNSVSMIYVLTDRLRVRSAGQGTLSPNYSNALLEIGKAYSMKAAGSNGHVFTTWALSTNWLGGVSSNSATLNFMMQANLTVQANFADTNKPTISITNLVVGQRLSNAVFTVCGKASDNARVTKVNLQLNSDVWTNATGTTNWAALLNLAPGTNVIRAYATDAAGNSSPTNTLSFQYVVTNQLQLAITGKGTLSPNYSNAWLEIGRAYTVTATPATGFMFTNWMGGTTLALSVLTNKPGLGFIMQSDLQLVANLMDTNRPTLSILNPVNNQRLGGNNVTMAGKTTDNWRVINVWYRANSNGWQTVSTTNNYTNWTVVVSLYPGTNTFMAYAQDWGGNNSLTNTVRVVATNVVTLWLNPKGPVQQTSRDGFALGLELSANMNGRVEYSTDLLHWTNLTHFTATNQAINVHDHEATNANRRFYRAVTP